MRKLNASVGACTPVLSPPSPPALPGLPWSCLACCISMANASLPAVLISAVPSAPAWSHNRLSGSWLVMILGAQPKVRLGFHKLSQEKRRYVGENAMACGQADGRSCHVMRASVQHGQQLWHGHRCELQTGCMQAWK